MFFFSGTVSSLASCAVGDMAISNNNASQSSVSESEPSPGPSARLSVGSSGSLCGLIGGWLAFLLLTKS